MKFNELKRDEEAISPVIGVILMVAITVVIAAVVGAFVMGMTGNMDSAPQAQFTFEKTGSGNVEVTHNGGDKIPVDEIAVKSDATPTEPENDGLSGDITAGDSWTVASGASDGDEIRIIWQSQETDQTSVLAEFEY